MTIAPHLSGGAADDSAISWRQHTGPDEGSLTPLGPMAHEPISAMVMGKGALAINLAVQYDAGNVPWRVPWRVLWRVLWRRSMARSVGCFAQQNVPVGAGSERANMVGARRTAAVAIRAWLKIAGLLAVSWCHAQSTRRGMA
jgi:hypothetical protein